MACTIFGVTIWVFNLPADHYVFWSAGLTTVAGSVCMVVGILMIQDIRMMDYEGIRQRELEKKARKKARKKLMEMA